MATVHEHTHRPHSKSHMIYTIAVIGFIYVLHGVIPMYSNSNYLSLFANEQTVAYIYMLGAAVSILGYLFAPTFIRRLGNYRAALILTLIQIGLFYGMATTTSGLHFIVLFILQTAVISLIGLCLDIFLEIYTDGMNVGTVRGMYTATLNASWVIGPLIGGMIINGTNNYQHTYVAAFWILFPLLYLIYRNFSRFKDPNYNHLSPWQLVKHVGRNSNWVKLFIANTVLQVFYAWMTVYSTKYLHINMGFSWEQMATILVIMLLPFPLIQYPLGKLADKKYGEKEIMALGFLLLGVSTIALTFITSHSVAVWAIALFITRIGAAAVEIMIETYFFATVSARDSAALEVFRITRPLSFFIAPIITLIALGGGQIIPAYLFAVMGVITLFALYPVLTIKDTK